MKEKNKKQNYKNLYQFLEYYSPYYDDAILSALTRLRQICVNPGMFMDEYKGESAKINLLCELLVELIENKHKVLIFSQFTSIFDTIGKKLQELGC